MGGDGGFISIVAQPAVASVKDLKGRSVSVDAMTTGFAFVVRTMHIEFLKPAKIDDVLDIVTLPHEVKGASITLSQEVRRGDDLLVEAKVRVAFVSQGRARPIPKPLRLAMKADQQDGSKD